MLPMFVNLSLLLSLLSALTIPMFWEIPFLPLPRKSRNFKKGIKLVLLPQEEEARKTILKEAQEKSAPVSEVEKNAGGKFISRKSGSLFSFLLGDWGEGVTVFLF